MSALVVRLIFWVWFGAAVVAGHSLWLQRLPPAGVPVVIFGLSALLLYAYVRLAPVRQWIDAVDLRTLVLLHVTRFIGVIFLILYHRGQLPYAFAVPAGIGDIIVAAFALPVALAPLEWTSRLRAISIWNIAGLIDILLVVGTAARLNLEDPDQLRALTQLPLSLLPTFLVPLIIASHVVLYVRVARARRA